MYWKCKNCGHGLIPNSPLFQEEPTHKTLAGGTNKKCVECDCTNPQRCREPILCSNCGHEIKKKRNTEVNRFMKEDIGSFYHANFNNTNNSSPARVGDIHVELEKICKCGCKQASLPPKPEPEMAKA